MKRIFTPENITSLKPNEIFCFGSNMNGNHAGGAAKVAVEKFGAIEGRAEGLQGQSYAVPTLDKDMQKISLNEIRTSIERLIAFADENPDLVFYVTRIGCGIAGFETEEIASLFKSIDFTYCFNIVLPKEFSLIRGVKGFDKNMQCRKMQFEEGKEYTQDGEISCCNNGIHFCENPLQVLPYYKPTQSIFHHVEGSGDIDTHDEDSKVSVSKLKISGRIEFPKLIEFGIEYTRRKVDFFQNRALKLISKHTSDYSVNSGWDSSVNSGRNSSVNSGRNYSVNSGLDSSVNSGWDSSVNSGLDSSVNSGRNYSVNSGRNSSVNSGRNYSVNSGRDYSVNSGRDYSVNSGRNYSVNSGRNSSVNSGWDSSVNSGLDSSVNSGRDYSVNSGRNYSVNSGRDYSVCAGRHESTINLNGKNSFGIAGKNSKIKGKTGCAICLVEHDLDYNIIGVKSAIIDGVNLKEDTYYKLIHGEFVETE